MLFRRGIVGFLCVAIVGSLCATATAQNARQTAMPGPALRSVNFENLDAAQALTSSDSNFKSFGYITKLIIAGREFKADLSANAASVGVDVPKLVVAPMTNFKWTGGASSPITFGFALSTANGEFLRRLVATVPESNIAPIDFAFVIYSYDSSAKRWFASCTGAGKLPLDAAAQNSGSYRWSAESTPYAAVATPGMIGASITCIPQDTPQKIALRAAATADAIELDW